MHEQGPAGTHLHLELSRRLQEGQALDVAHGAAYFHHGDVGVTCAQHYPALDLVGDVRDHLHGAAQVVTATLLAQHRVVHAAGGEIIGALHGGVGEALVVTQVEVGFSTVLGDKNLAVLERAHGARIDVDVGVQFKQRDFEAPGLKHCGQGSGGYPLPQRRNNAASDENISRHGLPLFTS